MFWARIRREWYIRKSLVDVFATFLLLSYVKILNVSISLLIPTALYNVHGQKLPEYVLYLDGKASLALHIARIGHHCMQCHDNLSCTVLSVCL